MMLLLMLAADAADADGDDADGVSLLLWHSPVIPLAAALLYRPNILNC